MKPCAYSEQIIQARKSMELDKMTLRLFQFYGAGDLFDAKAFILEWARIAGVPTAELACQEKFWPIFQDVPHIQCVPLTPMDNSGKSVYRFGDTLYVNTWVGQKGFSGEPGSYVLHPGTGCVLEKIYQMHNDLLREAGFGKLHPDMTRYIPTIDYSRVPLGNCEAFVKSHAGKKLILICNGVTTSLHASNFQYYDMLDYLPPKEGVIYLFTEQVDGPSRPDVFFTDDITNRGSGCDLNAIGYLSQFCNVIIGRCSGPFMFAQTWPNWIDVNKTLVAFTHTRNGACFIRNPEALGLKMRVLQSPVTDAKSAAEVIRPLLK